MPEFDGRAPFTATDRKALRAVALQFFVNGALFASFVPRLPEIRDRVGLTVGGIGLLLSIAGAIGIVGSFIVGPAISRFGTRAVMFVGGMLMAASLATIGLGTTTFVLVIGIAGMSTIDVLVDVGMNLQGSWLSARRHTPVMNRLHGLWSLGTVVGGLVASQAAALDVSITAHLVAASVILAAVVAFVSTGLLRTDEEHADEPESAQGPVGSERVRGLMMLFGLAGLFAFTIEQVSGNWAAFRFTDDFGRGPGFGAIGFVASTAGMTFGRFIGDWATVQLGQKQLSHTSVSLAAIGLAMASFAPDPYVSLVGYVLSGIGIAPMFPVLYDLAARHRGRKGAALGALTAGMRVGSLGIPLIIGAIADTRLSIGAATAIVTLPCTLGFFLVNAQIWRDR